MGLTEFPYVKVPHWYFDLLPGLSDAENRCLLHIFRQTYGWQQEEAAISYTSFQNGTGLSRASVTKGLKLLREKGVIKQRTSRIHAQQIQILPPQIVMGKIVQNLDSLGQNLNQQGVYLVNQPTPDLADQEAPGDHPKENGLKKTDKKTMGGAGIQALEEIGISIKVAQRLVRIARLNKKDDHYILDLVEHAKRSADNPAGMVRALIERNESRSAGQQRPGRAGRKAEAGAVAYAKRMGWWKESEE
jgi:phage replication O-like protein O